MAQLGAWIAPMAEGALAPAPRGTLLFVPERRDIDAAVAVARNTAPGLDGLPAEAWRAAGRCGSDVLLDAALWLAEGRRMRGSFQDSIAVCFPKRAEDGVPGATPAVRAVRLLPLKSTGCKAVCAAAARRLRAPVAQWCAWLQRGFVAGRQLLLNLVQTQVECVIAASRAVGADFLDPAGAGNKAGPPRPRDDGAQERWPAALFLDVQAAFPSVSWHWLWHVLGLTLPDEGFQRLTRAVYTGSAAMLRDTGGYQHAFAIQGGVMKSARSAACCSAWCWTPCFGGLVRCAPPESERRLARMTSAWCLAA